MPEPLRLAVLVKSFTRTGGMERYVVEICRRLAAMGHRLDIYAREADPELLEGMGFYQMPAASCRSSVLAALSFARQSARLLAGKKYDLVHSHERAWGCDLVSLHCFSHRQGLAGYSFLRWLDQRFLSLRNLLYLCLEKRQMASPWLIAVSEAIAEDVSRNYHRAEQVAVIPPGVDIESFSPATLAGLRQVVREAEGVREEELLVLFLGSEFTRKGLDRLLPALSPVMRLLVVGRGDNLPRYRRLVAEYGLSGRVRFAGLLSEVLPAYAAADLLVLPSRSEAFGMSALEAMACGLPVVVSANAGVAALIRHGENGFLFKADQELAPLLRQLVNPDLRRRLGDAARSSAEACTWERAAYAHDELYRRIIAEKRKQGTVR